MSILYYTAKASVEIDDPDYTDDEGRYYGLFMSIEVKLKAPCLVDSFSAEGPVVGLKEYYVVGADETAIEILDIETCCFANDRNGGDHEVSEEYDGTNEELLQLIKEQNKDLKWNAVYGDD